MAQGAAKNPDVLPATIGQWTGLAYATAWSDYMSVYARGRYSMDSNGYVHVEGLMAKVTGGSNLIATLPVGFRPEYQHIFQMVSNVATSGSQRVDVASNGNIAVSGWASGDTGWCSLSGISFYAGVPA